MLVWVEMDITQVWVLTFGTQEKNNSCSLECGERMVSRDRRVDQAKNKYLNTLTASLTYLDAYTYIYIYI